MCKTTYNPSPDAQTIVRGAPTWSTSWKEIFEAKGGSGKAMTGQQLWEAARGGDAAKVSTLLSTQGAQSFMNYQDAHEATPIHVAAIHWGNRVSQICCLYRVLRRL